MKLNDETRATSAFSRPTKRHVQPLAGRAFEVDRPPTSSTSRSRASTTTSTTDGRVMDSMPLRAFLRRLPGRLYLLTGRHGFFDCLRGVHPRRRLHGRHSTRSGCKICNQLPWRQDIASFEPISSPLTSGSRTTTVITHQDPGFLDHIANKKADVVRMYLPPDANCLLSCFDHCVKSKNYVNVIVASKHPSFAMADHGTGGQALHAGHQHLGLGVERRRGEEPDLVMACCGDTPTLEALAATYRSCADKHPRAEDPRGQRGRPDETAAARRTSRTG